MDATTTPVDMVVLNDLDRSHLVMDAIERVPELERTCAHVKQSMRDKLIEDNQYFREHGDDKPEAKYLKWSH